MNPTPKRSAGLVTIVLGFGAWAAFFAAIYGMQALGCRLSWDGAEVVAGLSLQRLQLIALYIAGLAVMLALYVWIRRQPDLRGRDTTKEFLRKVSVHGALGAGCAVIVSFAGVLWLTAC